MKVVISQAKDESTDEESWLTKKVDWQGMMKKVDWWSKSIDKESWLKVELNWWRKLIDE